MKKNLEILVEWLNDNKEHIFEGKYYKFRGSPKVFQSSRSNIIASYAEKPDPNREIQVIDLNCLEIFSLKDILLDHSVAKRRWGGDPIIWDGDEAIGVDGWAYELQTMVLIDEKEMLEYFCENVK